jgi:membrane peptidoglycan carboxypeptidase
MECKLQLSSISTAMSRNYLSPEAAVIASILRSPGFYDPALSKNNQKRLEARFKYVIQGMLGEKMDYS